MAKYNYGKTFTRNGKLMRYRYTNKKKSSKKKSPRKQSPKKRKLNTPTKKEETPVNKEKETPVKEEMEQPSEREKLRKRAHDDMIAECMCAMCMEILVKSTFAYPWLVRVCIVKSYDLIARDLTKVSIFLHQKTYGTTHALTVVMPSVRTAVTTN